MKNLDDHVGKLLLALDFQSICSPTLEAIVAHDASPNDLAEKLRVRIEEVVREVLGDNFEWSVPFEIKVHGRTKIIKTKAERRNDFENNLRELQKMFQDSEKDRLEQIKENPDNGKFGIWVVEGVRHCAYCKASNADEAISKCNAIVDGWENPIAKFIGEEMPDILEA